MRDELYNAMLDEIHEEPKLFQLCLENRRELTKDFVKLFQTHEIKRVYFSGSGSPSHVGLIMKYAVIRLLGAEATYSYPMLFHHHDGFNINGAYKAEEMVLICPAESGRSKGAVLAARRARSQGIPIICTTLNPSGVLARECDVIITKPSGHERALPSTKGHSTGIFILLLCIVETAFALGRLTEAEHQEYIDDFYRLIESARDGADRAERWFFDHQAIVMNAPFYRVIGYGANYGTALETALKFIETHKKLTMAYELEEFLHGPIRTVKADDVIFLLCTEDGDEKERMKALYGVLKRITDNCVLVCDEKDSGGDPLALTFKAVNREFLSAVEYMTPMQVLAYEIGVHLGFDPTSGTNTWAKLAMEPSFED